MHFLKGYEAPTLQDRNLTPNSHLSPINKSNLDSLQSHVEKDMKHWWRWYSVDDQAVNNILTVPIRSSG